MGVNLKDLVPRHNVTLESLAGKKYSVDGFNTLYQFLSTIRQPDGNPLKDSKGRVTSHLNGLFNRASYLIRHNIRVAFVFDGKVPDLKRQERERRKKLKLEAKEKFEKAKQEQNLAEMKKYAQRTTRLTTEMVDQSKELLDAMGIPWIQAPSEGEAQAAFLAKKGDVYAAVSQDYDTLLYQTPRLIQNLSVAAKKKMPGKLSYQTVSPQQIDLKEVLQKLNLTQEQLTVLCMLIGTDYNPGGVKGIGPKKSLALLQKHEDINEVFKQADFENACGIDPFKILDLFKSMPVQEDYSLKWKHPDHEKIKELLIKDFEFSKNRVESQLEKIESSAKARQQRSLADF